METSAEQSILYLLQDIDCLEQLRPWTEKINVFNVLKIARTEIRHSNMLAWLLDPNENHRLGSSFLQAFITDLSKSHSYEFSADGNDINAIIPSRDALELLSSDLTDTRVFREWNHIDVLLKLPKGYVIAIENKVDASEGKRKGKSQLEDYDGVLKANNFEPCKTFKVYLTPNGDKPSQTEWTVYTYYDVFTILNRIYSSYSGKLSDEANLLINNYIEILNNEIMDDSVLKNLCNEIYKKHKEAFDLIYENRESVTSMASLICFDKLKEVNAIMLVSDKPGVNIKFTTEWSRNFRDKLAREIDVNYVYEFRPNGDYGVKATLQLVLHNSSKEYEEESTEVINAVAAKNKCKKDRPWEWKRIWVYRPKEFNEVNDAEIGDWIDKSYKEIKKYEEGHEF